MKTNWKPIQDFYDRESESDRITAEFDLERHRTLDILSRFLPPPPAVIYDVGGGTGVHAFPLAKLGYKVHLIEPVESQVEAARKADSRKILAAIETGNALALSRSDHSADAVLLFGPLYHLIHAEERLQALREARRVLKPGGLVFTAALARHAYLIHCISRKSFVKPEIQEMLTRSWATGVHEPPAGIPFFTTAYLHRMDELRDEHRTSGFRDVRILGVEGPVWRVEDEAMRAKGGLSKRLEFLRRIEEEPDIVGASAHLMAVARAP